MNKSRRFFCVIVVFLSLFAGSALQAHTSSSAYLTFSNSPTALTGEWHLALRDLEDAVGVDSNDDGKITWAELLAHQQAIYAYVCTHLRVQVDGREVTLRPTDLLVDNHSDGAYAVVRFVVEDGGGARRLQITYNAFFDMDPKHRGLMRLENGGVARLAVFAPDTAVQTFDLETVAATTPFLTFLKEGIWHIWSGYDHILFLMALLLPGVLKRDHGQWLPVADARSAFTNILKIVTAFTVAHSITLCLSALGYVHLPTRLVESAIAASVVLAAFNNIVPFFAERGWLVAFGFGLLHGFGFANALRDLGLQHGQLAATLLGFNLGVEVGQLAIVAVFLPLALSLRRLLFYQRFVLRFGSVAIALVASTWLAERALNFKWLPF